MSKRNEKLITDYRDKLLARNMSLQDINKLLSDIRLADVTNGKYSRFLLDCFLNNTLKLEDLQGGLDSTVGITISLFHKYKDNLDIKKRSVNIYKSPGDLWNAVKPFSSIISGKEEKKHIKEQAYKETKFLYNDEKTGLKIVVPLSEQSAKWWGKGTRWCTSAEKNNMFNYYAQKAPLYILIMPDNTKLQIWKYNNDIQFMDEADNEVKIEYIENNWDILKPICLWSKQISYIPKRYQTYDIYKDFVKNNYHNFQYISNDDKDYKLCEIAIQQNGRLLKHVPDSLQPEFYEMALRQNGLALAYIPDKIKDYTLCKIAVENNGYAIMDVPDIYINSEISHIAVLQKPIALEYVPKKYRTRELCEIALNQDGRARHYIPDHILKTSFMNPYWYKKMILNYGQALRYIPIKDRDYELCKLSVQEQGTIISNIPHQYQEKLCKMAIQTNLWTINFLPPHLRTEEIYNYIIETWKDHKDFEGIIYKFPNEYQAKCHDIIKQNQINALKGIENKYQTNFNEILENFQNQKLSNNKKKEILLDI